MRNSEWGMRKDWNAEVGMGKDWNAEFGMWKAEKENGLIVGFS